MLTVGFLYPGYGAEDDYPYINSLLPEDVELKLVHTSVGVDSHDVESLLDLGKSERLMEGAKELAKSQPDSVIWACTSGSFVFGLAGAQKQVAEVANELNIPASSTSLAFVDAIKALHIKTVAIAATYPEDVAKHFKNFLEDSGITVKSLKSHDVPTAAAAGQLNPDEVVRLARDNTPADVEAILLPDTAMHTARIVTELEETLQKTVLTANQVTVWKGLRLAGFNETVEKLGSLFKKA